MNGDPSDFVSGALDLTTMHAGPGRQAVGAIGPLDRACASDPSPGMSVAEAHRDHEAEKDEESRELNRTLVRDSFV